MTLQYNIDIDTKAIVSNLNRITNQIYKLLPIREEGENWQLPLLTLIEEIGGMSHLLTNQHEQLFSVLCKLEGMTLLIDDKDFFLYRRTIFECLGIIGQVKADVSA